MLPDERATTATNQPFGLAIRRTRGLIMLVDVSDWRLPEKMKTAVRQS